MKRMTKMTQYEVHIELFRVLQEVDHILKKHNIPYFLIFGSLLGCVRDGGYIPWDDDIDIAVMPEYWDKMNKILPEEIDRDKYFVINKLTRPDYPVWHLLTRVGVNGTARKMDYFKENVNGKSGIFIDIFSVVKVPKNRVALKIWDWKLGIIDSVINLKAYKKGTYKEPSLLSTTLYRIKYKNSSLYDLNIIRDKIQCSYNNRDEKFVAVPFGPYGRYPIEKTRYRTQWVKLLERKIFSVFNKDGEIVESFSVPVPSGFNSILKTTYGEWEKRPRGERPKEVSYWEGRKMAEKNVKQQADPPLSFKREDFDRDTAYWNDYYKMNKASSDASLFAQNIFENYLKGKNGKLLELGCGNGRDSKFFISKGYEVTAIDASKSAIEKLQSEFAETKKGSFLCGDFVNEIKTFQGQYDFCYSRFSIHAINNEQEGILIKNVFNAIKPGGAFFIETRGVHDELYGLGECVGEDAYFYNGHYRRFIRKEKLQKNLEKAGFWIVRLEEMRGFAPYGREDPMIIRCIAKRK